MPSARDSDRGERRPEPRNCICVLLDSLNRHLVGAYGGGEFDTSNLDAFARRSTRFLRHYSGSLPCIPARHELLCGTHGFLWKPWGAVELWDEPFPRALTRAGVATMLVTDHYHLFKSGGENYHLDYLGWEFLRGHEGDLWATEPVDTSVGTPQWLLEQVVGDSPGAPVQLRRDAVYARNRARFSSEEDFPGPRTMAAAAAWLDRNAHRHDRFFLMVDEFDPHEPFDTPEPYRSMYERDSSGDPPIWPPYARQRLDPGVARRVRAQYGGKLTMIDRWFGELVSAIDRNQLWDDTMVVVLTDHGIFLGEHDTWGKPAAPHYEELVHIPLLVHYPGRRPGTIDALTTTVDLYATFLDLFGAAVTRPHHGRSLLPVLRGEAPTVREFAIAGQFGRRPLVTDGRYTYERGWRNLDAPLYAYSNRWSWAGFYRLPVPDARAELGMYLPGTDIPVIRQPLTPRETDMAGRFGMDVTGDLLFDVSEDPHQSRDLSGEPGLVRECEEMLHAALDEAQAPPEHYERLGL